MYDRVQATRGKDYAFIYSIKGKSFTVNMGKISGTQVNAWWFDPKNGQTKLIGSFANKGQQKFSPPTEGYGHDWVLIMDDTTKKYSTP